MPYGAYSDQVLDHFDNPRQVGSLDQANPASGTAIVGTPASGGVIRLQIAIDDHGLIEAVSFKAYGCAYTIACGSWLSEWVKGRSVEEADRIGNAQIAEALALPPVRIHCAVLAEQALKAAIDNYMIRQANGLR